MSTFLDVAAEIADQVSPATLRAVADRLGQASPRAVILHSVPAGAHGEVAGLLDLLDADSVPTEQAVAYLRGVAAGYERRAAALQVEAVWSGPSTHSVPLRATAQVLVELVSEASWELVLMTYSAKPYPPLLDALAAASERGVAVSIVVETLQGAGSALSGTEPAAAFLGVPGVALWHWPTSHRREASSKMHAKIAVADRRVLLASSANLTQSGVDKNIEAGVLVRGGTVPRRAAEHVRGLQENRSLVRLL